MKGTRPNKKTKVGNRKAGSRKNNANGMRLASHPPQMLAQEIRSIKIRTLATAALSNQIFQLGDLTNILGVVARTATTAKVLAQVYRLKKIHIWGPVAVSGTPVVVQLTWNNTAADFVGPPITILDTAVSFDWPAYVSSSPPPGSLSAKWHDSLQTDTTFTLSCPTGSTVDFEFDWILSDLQSENSNAVLVAATVGEIYHLITHTLVPQGVNSI